TSKFRCSCGAPTSTSRARRSSATAATSRRGFDGRGATGRPSSRADRWGPEECGGSRGAPERSDDVLAGLLAGELLLEEIRPGLEVANHVFAPAVIEAALLEREPPQHRRIAQSLEVADVGQLQPG